jgi:signal transduction histidine kinase
MVIKDEGCGIPEAIRETVFNRFESRSQGSKHRGVGLGLSIVKSIVDLHGGDIELLSKEGVGTKITVRFPKDGKATPANAAEQSVAATLLPPERILSKLEAAPPRA